MVEGRIQTHWYRLAKPDRTPFPNLQSAAGVIIMGMPVMSNFERLCREADASRAKEKPSLKTWRDGLITAKALQTKTFAPVRIIVPGLIPEGVTILAGKPKIGKSWLALDVCAAVASDRFVLGETKPVQGDALYLALEDNQRRLKKRTDKIMQNAAGWPESLEMHTEWKRVDQGGLDDIEEWCKAHPRRRLIWIDTLAKIRPIIGRLEQAYTADYRAIEGLQKLAGEYQVGIVLNHHLRKASSEDDAFDDVSGTLGLTGAADTNIVMKRHAGMVKIYVRGRDIEEAEFAAEFNRNTCRWHLVGGADEVFRSQERQAIIAALKDAKDKDGNRVPLSVAEIMAAIERTDRNAVYQLLFKMCKAGEIAVVGRGLYTWLDTSDPLNAGKIGKKGPSEAAHDTEVVDNPPISATSESYRGSYRDLTGADTGKIAGKIAETSKPLANNGNAGGSYRLTNLTDTLKGDGLPPGQAMARVFIKEVRPCSTSTPGGGNEHARFSPAGEHLPPARGCRVR
jgi:AAA domain